MEQYKHILSINGIKYEVVDNDHIKVTHIGTMDENYTSVENLLFKIGMVAVRRGYDKKENMTHTTYKILPKNVIPVDFKKARHAQKTSKNG